MKIKSKSKFGHNEHPYNNHHSSTEKDWKFYVYPENLFELTLIEDLFKMIEEKGIDNIVNKLKLGNEL